MNYNVTSENVTIKGADEVYRLLQQMPDETFKILQSVFRDTILTVHKKVTNKFVGGPLHNRTGLAAKSFKTALTGNSLDTIKGSVFSGLVNGQPLVYIPLHEFGGTIVAKNAYKFLPGGPFLNIPLAANRTPSGIQQKTSRQVFQEGGRIAGRVIYSATGEKMFALASSVTIKPRLGFYDTASEEASKVMPELSKRLPAAWRNI